jgi:DNA-binding response OmpR family regulator
MGTAHLVLLVEDDDDLGHVLTKVIGGRGYRVQLCQSGRQALASLAEERPSLVILDWLLPDLPADEVAAKFVAAGVPVVLASGSEGTRETARRIGARATLEKPYAMNDVFQVLERLLGPAPSAYS